MLNETDNFIIHHWHSSFEDSSKYTWFQEFESLFKTDKYLKWYLQIVSSDLGYADLTRDLPFLWVYHYQHA